MPHYASAVISGRSRYFWWVSRPVKGVFSPAPYCRYHSRTLFSHCRIGFWRGRSDWRRRRYSKSASRRERTFWAALASRFPPDTWLIEPPSLDHPWSACASGFLWAAWGWGYSQKLGKASAQIQSHSPRLGVLSQIVSPWFLCLGLWYQAPFRIFFYDAPRSGSLGRFRRGLSAARKWHRWWGPHLPGYCSYAPGASQTSLSQDLSIITSAGCWFCRLLRWTSSFLFLKLIAFLNGRRRPLQLAFQRQTCLIWTSGNLSGPCSY